MYTWINLCYSLNFIPGSALQVLKQKRLYENQRGQLMNQQFNVDQTSFALQSMQDSVQTVQAMKAAGKELKAAFKQPELNINSIENLQDDLADMMVRFLMSWCRALTSYVQTSVMHMRCGLLHLCVQLIRYRGA